MRITAFVFLLLIAPQTSVTAGAQNTLEDAKAQYEAAAYEQALETLRLIGQPSALSSRVQVEQYRALCLIALGDIADAERAVASLVAADPLYVPPPSVASPKVLAHVADMRKKELPAVARGLLDAGRTAFQAKDLARTQERFNLLLKLLDDPAMRGRPEKEDLRALAEGFVTLAAATAAALPGSAAALGRAPGSAAPANAPAPIAPAGVVPPPASTPPASAPPKAPAVEPANAKPTEPIPDSAPSMAVPESFVPATAIDQPMPEWEPPSATAAGFDYDGRLRIQIGADGSVTSAEIEQASHPLYDARLLEVAPTWRYKPAMRNGVPIESERVIVVTLRAQR